MFLGSSESPGGLLEEFDTLDEHAKVYRKRRDIGLPRDLKLPLPRAGVAQKTPVTSTGRGASISPQLLATYDRLLDRFMPPSFLVDEHGQLLDTYGGVEALLKMKGRRPSQNLLEMLTDDLRSVVGGAFQRVKRDAEPVRYGWPGARPRGPALYAERGTGPRCAWLTRARADLARSRAERRSPARRRRPNPRASRTTAPAQRRVDFGILNRDQMHALQDELSYTKENLQSAIQELETTNEELQATNEELIASNEELQSTNEELHSVNEELYTVNAEYQKKNVELQELNDDIEHLLNGTDVGTMFLDRDLCIRKFTPRVGDVFHVIPNDSGRPLRSFSHELMHPTLMRDIESRAPRRRHGAGADVGQARALLLPARAAISRPEAGERWPDGPHPRPRDDSRTADDRARPTASW